MDIELKQNSFPRSKTEKVLENWASNESGEIQKESIRRAASEYAKLEVNNKILKWIIAVVVVFMFVLLGFMIASVVLGVHITKEVTVKNGQLVSSGNGSVVKTSNVKYINKISLSSPSSVIDSLTSISVNINEGLYQGVLHFEVVSYVFVPGKQLTFFGHSHQADIQPDGSVKLTSLVAGKRDGEGGTGNSPTGTGSGSGLDNAIEIDNCADFATMTTSGNYRLTKGLVCTGLTLPLLAGQTFSGNFDGAGHSLKVTYSGSGSVALFASVSGSISNLLLDGSLSGNDQCATFAINALSGSKFSKLSSSVEITCGTGTNNVAGGFFANIVSDIEITGSVSQAKINFDNSAAVVGGFFAKSSSSVSISVFNLNAFDAVFNTPSTNKAQVGFYNGLTSECKKELNYILVETGQTRTEFTCFYPLERAPNLADYKNCNGVYCYSCRDTSSRNLSKRAAITDLRTLPAFCRVVPAFPQEVCY